MYIRLKLIYWIASSATFYFKFVSGFILDQTLIQLTFTACDPRVSFSFSFRHQLLFVLSHASILSKSCSCICKNKKIKKIEIEMVCKAQGYWHGNRGLYMARFSWKNIKWKR